MESPLLKPILTPRCKIVVGRHVTIDGNWFNIQAVGDHAITAHFGGDSDMRSALSARSLRELSALFSELALALEQQ